MAKRWYIPLLALLLASTQARADVVLILRREAKPAGNYVRVCDIARVEGPSEHAREVAETVLGPAPRRGESQSYTRWDVENRLYEMGIALRVTFSGNDMVRVYGDGVSIGRRYGERDAFHPLEPVPARHSNGGVGVGNDGTVGAADMAFSRSPVIKPEPKTFAPSEHPGSRSAAPLSPEDKARLGQAISTYLADRYRQNGVERPDLEVEASVIRASSSISGGAYEVRVEEALDGRVPGRAILAVAVKDTAEAPARRVEVEAETQVFGKSLVAARSLPRGESLEKRDVAVARVRMDSGKGYFPPNPGAIDGRELKRAYRPGEAIVASDAAPGLAVKRGEVVRVATAGKGWLVECDAKALGNGMQGDQITVEDVVTKKKFTVRVVGRGKAEVVIKKTYGK